MKEQLSLTTRALGEAESLIDTYEKTIKTQESMLLIKDEQLEEKITYFEEYHKEYKKNASRNTAKKVIIAFVVGTLIGIVAAI